MTTDERLHIVSILIFYLPYISELFHFTHNK